MSRYFLTGGVIIAAWTLSAAPVSIDLTEGWFAQPLQISDLKNVDRSECPAPLEDPKADSEKTLDELMADDSLLGLGDSGARSVKTRKKRSAKTAKDKKGKKGKKGKPSPAPASATASAPASGRYVARDGRAVNWMPKPISLDALVPLATIHKGAEPADAYNDTYACWFRKTVRVPADWQGALVTLEQEIGGVEVVVFVNGKRCGTMLPPIGFVDLSKVLEFGKDNEIRLFATNRGLGTGTAGVRYRARDDIAKQRHFFSPMKLSRRADVILEDVFADTSVREKKISLHSQIYAKTAQKATLSFVISEERSGKTVKTIRKTVDLVAGANKIEVSEPWSDAVLWEPGRPFLYACASEIEAGAAKGEAPEKFIFGFREVWRERGQLIFNGHPQSVRGFWGGGMHDVDKDFGNFLKAGFNAVYQTHQHESRFRMPRATMELYARKGILTFIGAPSIASCRKAATDPELAAEYARYCEYWARSVRNYPSAVGVSVGVNMMCAASWTMGARDMGKGSGKGDIVEACRFVKRFHPNALAFAHGDGNLCDIGCSNFYFNFTPLQERLEWYSDWFDRRNREDTIPYYAAEFGQPYYGSWFGGAQPSMTEWCAIYDGEAAYRAEQPRMLAEMRAFAYSKAGNYYGGFVAGDKQGSQYTLYDFSEGGRRLHERFVREVGRAWRAWGCRISPMYLDDVSFKPGSNNWELAIHSLYNHDLCVFLGGDPSAKARFADQTHSYWPGEKAVKSIVAVWDGLGEEKVEASWALMRGKKTLLKGSKTIQLKQGDVVWDAFEFDLPSTPGKYELVANFKAKNLPASERTDRMWLEVAAEPSAIAGVKAMAILDPRGESSAALEQLGLSLRKVTSLEDLAAAAEQYIVIGRRALDDFASTNTPAARIEAFAALAGKVAAGKRLLILSQMGETWRRIGFESEDSKPRIFYNCSLKGVEDDDLRYWRGEPLPLVDSSAWQWAPDWGPAQFWHKGGRGWRWKASHSLSLVTLLIPQRMGFRPLVRGEFDMAYSSLMRSDFGKGSIHVCALDFEGRTGRGKCPAATRVAAALMNDYFADRPAPTRRVAVSGKDARRLVDCLGIAAEEFSAGGATKDMILIAGNDTALTLREVRDAAAKGAKVLVVGNDEIAKQAGFVFTKMYETQIRWGMKKMEYAEDHIRDFKRPTNQAHDLADGDDMGLSLDEEKVEKPLPRKPKGIKDCEIPLVAYATTNKVERALCRSLDQSNWDSFPYQDVGLSMLRWRESSRPSLLSPRPGWIITADGVFAISDDKGVLLDQISPFKVLDERIRGGTGGKGDPIGKANYSLSLDNNLRRHALVLLNWGAVPNTTTLSRLFDLSSKESLYWSANPGYDPYGYVYW